MCSIDDDPSMHDVKEPWLGNDPEWDTGDHAELLIALGQGCDNAPSAATGHSGRCGSYEEHIALLRQGIGIGPSTGGASTGMNDHGRPEMRER